MQAATLERRVGELEDEVGQLAAAAQAAEEQAVQLMQQVQAAQAAEAEAARESSALAGQVCGWCSICMHLAEGINSIMYMLAGLLLSRDDPIPSMSSS